MVTGLTWGGGGRGALLCALCDMFMPRLVCTEVLHSAFNHRLNVYLINSLFMSMMELSLYWSSEPHSVLKQGKLCKGPGGSRVSAAVA